MDWRDLRIALALDRHRTLARAGQALGLDPTTVSRRLISLEKGIGVPLFLRRDGELVPTEAGERVVATAAKIAEEVQALGHDLDDSAKRVRGVVRMTSLDFVVRHVLAPRAAELARQYPELELVLDCTERVIPLGTGRADLALRLARPKEAGVRARRLATIPLGVYAAQRYLADRPAEDALVVVGPRGPTTLPEVVWLREAFPAARPVLFTNSLSTAYGFVRDGAGIGVLPCVVADGDPELARLGDAAPPPRELWLAVAESLARTPRLRAVIAWIERAVAAGELAPPPPP